MRLIAYVRLVYSFLAFGLVRLDVRKKVFSELCHCVSTISSGLAISPCCDTGDVMRDSIDSPQKTIAAVKISFSEEYASIRFFRALSEQNATLNQLYSYLILQ